jgi:hypothetical protein
MEIIVRTNSYSLEDLRSEVEDLLNEALGADDSFVYLSHFENDDEAKQFLSAACTMLTVLESQPDKQGELAAAILKVIGEE